jgi:hypothetical protein
MREVTSAGGRRTEPAYLAEVPASECRAERAEVPDRRTGATRAMGARAAGWLFAVVGWLGVALWYVTVLAGARPSRYCIGALCGLLLAQLGRVLLSGPAAGGSGGEE